jgi:multiple sugar transport system substrate-binding protein
MTPRNFLTTIFLAATLLFGLAEATYITTTALAPSHANFPFSLTPTLAQHKKQVTLIAMLDDLDNLGNWDGIIQPALQELRSKHPDVDIEIKLTTTPYNQTRSNVLNTLSNRTPIDLISVDQIWLGDFASKGFLTDLTDRVEKWGRISNWYQSNVDGILYQGKARIWAWTDVRGIWYWKDLLNQAGVDPDSLKRWDGYIESAKNSMIL